MTDQTTPATPTASAPPALDLAAAVPIAPRRDPVTARTVTYLVPAGSSEVHLFSAGRRYIGSAPAADWPVDQAPAAPDAPAS